MPLHTANNTRTGRNQTSITVVLFAFCLVAIFESAWGQNAKDIAIVLKTIGSVQFNRTGNGGWYVAKRGTRLNSGNVVQTAPKSLASIVFTDDKSLLKVRSKSKITINGKREKKGIKKTIMMRLGELWAKVTKGSFYRVETPSGVAAVKGTRFYLIYTQDGRTLTFCLEGLIEQITRFGNLMLNAGEVGEMRRDAPPTKRKFTADELPNWANDNTQEVLEIEFENEAGQKKKLNININRQQN
ncbi:MAG: FecR domain-containing protein [bacterium]